MNDIHEGKSSCLPSRKELKNRIKRIKKDMRDLLAITDRIGIYGEHVNVMIGSMFRELDWAEETLKKIKRGKK